MKKYEMINDVIDCHAHCGVDYSNIYLKRYPAFQSAITYNDILRKNGINYSSVFSGPNTNYFDISKYWKTQMFIPSGQSDFPFYAENSYLIAELKHFKLDNLLFFASISFQDKVMEQIEYIEELVKTEFVYGIKFHALADNKKITELLNYPKLIDLLIKYDLPIMCHTGMDEFSNPNYIIEVAEAVPELRLCAAHMAKYDFDFFNTLYRKSIKNLFVDTSPLISMTKRYSMPQNTIDVFNLPKDNQISQVLKLIKLFKSNIIWGSDCPWVYVSRLEEKCEEFTTYADEVSLLKSLGDDVVKQIGIINPNKFLFNKIIRLEEK